VLYDTVVSIYFAFEVKYEEVPADTSEQHKGTNVFISNRNVTGGILLIKINMDRAKLL